MAEAEVPVEAETEEPVEEEQEEPVEAETEEPVEAETEEPVEAETEEPIEEEQDELVEVEQEEPEEVEMDETVEVVQEEPEEAEMDETVEVVQEEPVEAEMDETVEVVQEEPVEAEMEQPDITVSFKDDGRAWYVVHCYSGNEDKVRHNIMQRIESMTMDDLIFDVVVPTEDEVNIKNGERQTVEKKVFPGYILVNMILTEESWYMVRNTPGVTGFVGMGNDPTPLQPEEVARILKRMESESPRINVTFRTGERVRIVDGPFEDFYGKVAEIDMERATVRIMVNFFGRETPVELDFLQVEEA
jgi:transcriptional antiterminator NusG